MKAVHQIFSWPVIVNLVAGAILLWLGSLFFQPKPQVVFTLTEPIKHQFMSGTHQNTSRVQQLIVTNIGTTSAKSVLVQFKKPVIDPAVDKFADTDTMTLNVPKPGTKPESGAEVNYAELRPQANFKVSFLTGSTAIQATDLVIKHADGDAEEATVAARPKSSDRLMNMLSSGLLLFQWLMIGIVARAAAQVVYKSKKREELAYSFNYKTVKASLEKRPWYLLPQDWKKERSRVLLDNINEMGGIEVAHRDIEKTTPFAVLNEERPDLISADDWKRICAAAVETVKDCVKYRVRYSYKPDDLADLCLLTRPRNFPEAEWQILMKSITDEMVRILLARAEHEANTAIAVLKMTKPVCFEDSLWEQTKNSVKTRLIYTIGRETEMEKNPLNKLTSYDLSVLSELERERLKERVRNNYFVSIMQVIRFAKTPLSQLSQYDLSGLTDKQLKDLEELAYSEQKYRLLPSVGDKAQLEKFLADGKPDWLRPSDFAALQDAANLQRDWLERVQKDQEQLRVEIERNQTLTQLLTTFAGHGKLPEERPAILDEDQWNHLKVMETAWRGMNKMRVGQES